MCGIAGVIYHGNGGGHAVGHDMTRMLQAMKHRGPDSTGFALYGPVSELMVMRYKLADANDARDFDFERTGLERVGEADLKPFRADRLDHKIERAGAHR